MLVFFGIIRDRWRDVIEKLGKGFINVEILRETFLSCLVRLGSCYTKGLSLFAMVVGSEHFQRSSNNFKVLVLEAL